MTSLQRFRDKPIGRDKYVTDCVIENPYPLVYLLGHRVELIHPPTLSSSTHNNKQWAVIINVQFARQLLLVHSM